MGQTLNGRGNLRRMRPVCFGMDPVQFIRKDWMHIINYEHIFRESNFV